MLEYVLLFLCVIGVMDAKEWNDDENGVKKKEIANFSR